MIWKMKPFPLYNNIQILIKGIVGTGDNAFRAGAVPEVPDSQSLEVNAISNEDEDCSRAEFCCSQLGRKYLPNPLAANVLRLR